MRFRFVPSLTIILTLCACVPETKKPVTQESPQQKIEPQVQTTVAPLAKVQETKRAEAPAQKTVQEEVSTRLEISKSHDIESDTSLLSFKSNGQIKDVLHHGKLLINGGTINLIGPSGKPENVLFPNKVNKSSTGDTVHIESSFKFKGQEVYFKSEAKLFSDKIHFKYKVDAGSFDFGSIALFFDLDTYSGKRFVIDEIPQEYPPKKPEDQKMLWNTIMDRSKIQQFLASDEKGLGIRIHPLKGTEATFKQIETPWTNGFSLFLHPNEQGYTEFDFHFPKDGKTETSLSAKPGENLIANGGFETGKEWWGVTFNPFDRDSSFRLNRSEKSEGIQSLQLNLKPIAKPFGGPKALLKLTSEFIKLPAQTKVTLSVDMKSDINGLPVDLVVRYRPVEKVANVGTFSISESIKLTTNWKRYSLTTRLPRGLFDAYCCGIEAKPANNGTEKNIYVDAFQLTPGTSSTYTPEKTIQISGNTPHKSNLFEPNEKVQLISPVKNNSSTSTTIQCSLKVLDPDYYEVLNLKKDFALKGGQQLPNVFEGAVIESSKQGAYRVYLEASENGILIDRYSYTFGIVKQLKNRTLNPDSKYGLHMGSNDYFGALDLASKIGFTWTRGGSFWNAWVGYESRKGNFRQEQLNKNSKIIDIHESLGMTPILNLSGPPKWASNAPQGSKEAHLYPPHENHLDAYANYTQRIANEFKGKIHAYEVWNEPNIPIFYRGTPQEFGNMLKTAYHSVKGVDPTAQVIAFGLTHYGKTASNFLKGVFDSVGTKYCDAVSFHPYCEKRLGPEETHVVEQFEWIEKDIQSYGVDLPRWATEFGWFAPHKNSPNFTPFKNAMVPGRLISEEECAKFYVQMCSSALAHGLEKLFYFIYQEGDIADRWFHGFVGPNGEFLKSAYYAAATMIRNTDYRDCIGQKRVLGDVVLTQFRKLKSDSNSQPTCILYKAKGAKEVKIKTNQPLNCEDINGNPFQLSPVKGYVYLTVSEDPLFILAPIRVTDIHDVALSFGDYLITGKENSTLSIPVEGKIGQGLDYNISSGILGQNKHSKKLSSKIHINTVDQLEKEDYKCHIHLYSKDSSGINALRGRFERIVRIVE